MSAPDRDAARHDLEDALNEISGLTHVMAEIDDPSYAYLSIRLREHYEEAHDAFSRIFGLDEYHPKAEEPQP